MKFLIKSFLLFIILISFAQEAPLKGKSVVFVIAPEFYRDEELLIPSTTLAELGADIQVASSTTENIEGMMGGTTKPNLLIKDINVDKTDAIILVGGMGAEKLWDNKKLHEKLQEFDSQDKIISAICLAPVVLGRAGLLKERNATCFASVKKELEKSKAKYIDKKVVVSGNIVTANGPDASTDFVNILSKLIEGPGTTKIHD